MNERMELSCILCVSLSFISCTTAKQHALDVRTSCIGSPCRAILTTVNPGIACWSKEDESSLAMMQD